MALHRLTRSHPRLTIATLAGLVGGWLIPAETLIQHLLAGWNLGVWLYVLLVLWLSWRATPAKVRKVAQIEDENAGLVLFAVCLAAIASLAAVVLQLAASQDLHGSELTVHYLYTGLTVAGSWLLIGCIFSLHTRDCSTPRHCQNRPCALPMASATRTTGTSTTSLSPSAWPSRPPTSALPTAASAGWFWHNLWWVLSSIRRFWGSPSISPRACWAEYADENVCPNAPAVTEVKHWYKCHLLYEKLPP